MEETRKSEQASGRGESLEHVELRFKRWRESRQRGEHIPPALWAAAVAVAKEHGLHRIAHELRVDYDGLKRRLERVGGAASSGMLDTRFVELSGNGLAGLDGLCGAFWSAPGSSSRRTCASWWRSSRLTFAPASMGWWPPAGSAWRPTPSAAGCSSFAIAPAP